VSPLSGVVLVTGAAGQVGRALVATAPPEWSVVALDRATLDIADEAAVAHAVASRSPALVINCAAYTSVDGAEQEAERAELVNATGAGALARAASTAKARFIHLSTDFVFDGARGSPYPPDAEPAPISAYGRSKLHGEALVRRAAPPALILRTAWVYAWEGRNFVRSILSLLKSRSEIGVVADQVGTPTWATGLAHAIWKASTMPSLAGTYHWTDAGVASWYDFAVAIREEALALGILETAARVLPITTAEYPLPARRPPYAVLDKSATWALLGTPPHWREQLRLMLRGAHAA
jgi:dTDP-4-dehydrorhamnose reductase